MTAFEALFAFYGLLLGLAIAAVVTGFGEQWRQRRAQQIGFLIPLLGIYVLLSATQQWQSLWSAREFLAMTPVNLLMCLGMALPYTFVRKSCSQMQQRIALTATITISSSGECFSVF